MFLKHECVRKGAVRVTVGSRRAILLASGSLLAAFPEDAAAAACEALARSGTAARAIGRAEPGAGVFRHDGSEITAPDRDEVARVLA